MGAEDRFHRLANEFANKPKDVKPSKHNRTLSLESKNFLLLQAYCKDRELKASDVIDRLIQEFLDALGERGELPPSNSSS